MSSHLRPKQCLKLAISCLSVNWSCLIGWGCGLSELWSKAEIEWCSKERKSHGSSQVLTLLKVLHETHNDKLNPPLHWVTCSSILPDLHNIDEATLWNVQPTNGCWKMCGPRAWTDTLAGLQSIQLTFTSLCSGNIAHHKSSPGLTNNKCTFAKWLMPADCTFLLKERPLA